MMKGLFENPPVKQYGKRIGANYTVSNEELSRISSTYDLERRIKDTLRQGLANEMLDYGSVDFTEGFIDQTQEYRMEMFIFTDSDLLELMRAVKNETITHFKSSVI